MATRKGSVIDSNIIFDDSGKALGVKWGVTGVGSHTIMLVDLAPNVIDHAACHGIKQRVGDAGAQDKGTSPQDKYDAMLKVHNVLTDPENPSWSARGEGGAGEGGLLAQAVVYYMAEVDKTEVTVAEAAKYLKDNVDKKAQYAMLHTQEDMKPYVERVRREREEAAKKRATAAPDEVKSAFSAMLAAFKKPADVGDMKGEETPEPKGEETPPAPTTPEPTPAPTVEDAVIKSETKGAHPGTRVKRH